MRKVDEFRWMWDCEIILKVYKYCHIVYQPYNGIGGSYWVCPNYKKYEKYTWNTCTDFNTMFKNWSTLMFLVYNGDI